MEEQIPDSVNHYIIFYTGFTESAWYFICEKLEITIIHKDEFQI